MTKIIKNTLYGVFYKQRGKWSSEPYQGALFSGTQVKTEGSEILKEARAYVRKPVKFKRQVWK
jgi:hypothetical protein